MAKQLKFNERERSRKIQELERFFKESYYQAIDYYEQAMSWAIDEDLMDDLWTQFLQGKYHSYDKWEDKVLNNTIDNHEAQHEIIQLLTWAADTISGTRRDIWEKLILWEELTGKYFTSLGNSLEIFK